MCNNKQCVVRKVLAVAKAQIFYCNFGRCYGESIVPLSF